MNFRENVWEKAKELETNIILPESLDERVQLAASIALKNGLAKRITFIGTAERIRDISKRENLDISQVDIIEHLKAKDRDEFVSTYYELRKHKGLTLDEAAKKMENPIYYGAMMVRKGIVNGMVAGAVTSTADLLRAAFHIVGIKTGITTASSCFIMIVPDRSFGFYGQMIFADCGIVPSPDPQELAEIAIASAETGAIILGFKPIIAMLSFSTKGSAKHESVYKVIEATRLIKKNRPDLVVDGELQSDAALVESVAKRKCPDSPVGGKANVLIFPDLNSGNIAYKLVQRLGRALAYGPILQGLSKPVNDLSRGCTYDEIVNVIAITSVQTQL